MAGATKSDEFFERIGAHSHPEIRLEHELRYHWPQPAIARADTWVDLGCGSGVGAATVDVSGLEHVVLVDLDEQALERARSTIAPRVPRCTAMRLDLSLAGDVSRLREELAVAGESVVTCFEVIEHLDSHQHLIELLVEAAREFSATCAISVPNDAFFGVDNPFHLSKWSSRAFDELVQFLPEPVVVAHQVALSGSYIAEPGAEVIAVPASDPHTAVASHFLAAFGRSAAGVEPVSFAAASNAGERRVWEAQREADLDYYRTRLAEREQDVAELSKLVSKLKASRFRRFG